jgi:hypothetical protein
MLCTREVGCIKSSQIDPPCLDLSAGLNPYRAGSDRIRENVSQAEKSITVASGCLKAKAERPRPSSSFQLLNRTPLLPMLGPSNFQGWFLHDWGILLTDRRHIQRWDVNEKEVASTSRIEPVLGGKQTGNYRGDFRLLICVSGRERVGKELVRARY